MSYPFPPDLQSLVSHAMSLGNYPSEDDVLRDAMIAWQERHEDEAAIAEGIADMEAGRLRPFADVAEEILNRYGAVDE